MHRGCKQGAGAGAVDRGQGARLVLQGHLLELVHAADPPVGQHQRARLERVVARDYVLHHRHRQPRRRGRVAAHVDAPGRRGCGGLEQRQQRWLGIRVSGFGFWVFSRECGTVATPLLHNLSSTPLTRQQACAMPGCLPAIDVYRAANSEDD